MWKMFSPNAESRGVRGGFEAASLRGHGSDAGEYRPRMGEPVGEEGHIKKGVGIPKQRQRAKEGYKKATVVARSRCRHAAQ